MPRRRAAAAVSQNGTAPKGEALRPAELAHVTVVIERWLRKEFAGAPDEPSQGQLS
jgi:hypothetical protein